MAWEMVAYSTANTRCLGENDTKVMNLYHIFAK